LLEICHSDENEQKGSFSKKEEKKVKRKEIECG